MQTSYRDAVPSDFSSISALVHATTRSVGNRPTAPGRSWRILDEIDRHDDCHLLVAECDRRISAVLQMVVHPVADEWAPTASIVGVWTATRSGDDRIDTGLIAHAVARARDLSCGRITVTSPGSGRSVQAMWARAGFRRAGQTFELRLDRRD